jgi:hypothetical protein
MCDAARSSASRVGGLSARSSANTSSDARPPGQHQLQRAGTITIFTNEQERLRRRQAFRERHGEAAADKFIAEQNSIRSQIRHGEWFSRFVLHPGKNSRILNVWDVITGTALLYTAILTPVEASFLPATGGAAALRDPWFWINRALDAIFAADVRPRWLSILRPHGCHLASRCVCWLTRCRLSLSVVCWLAPLRTTEAASSLASRRWF